MKKIEWIINEEGTDILGVRIGSTEIPIKNAVWADMGIITKHLNKLKEFIPFEEATWPKFGGELSSGTEWTKVDIKLTSVALTTRQKLFFKFIDRDDFIPTPDILEKFENEGIGNACSQTISGVRSGLTQYYYGAYGKEPLEESRWVEDTGNNEYRIKPKYRGFSKYLLVA